jgi:hypothetical protein
VTYPNVLVMGYLRETGSLTPEWRMKCEAAINAGYQRLCTFEVKGGGFDWYGGAPAKTILTAYGILELDDMDKVFPIDRGIIDRAKEVLYRRQKPDGSWTVDIPLHTWNQLSNSSLPITAYVVWALKEAGCKEEAVRRGEAWLQVHQDPKADPYVRALVALALGDRGSLAALEGAAQVKGDEARWPSAQEGLCHARGDMASIEATALAAIALEREGRSPLIDKALTAIARSKDAAGSWHSTQATILSIKALLEGSRTPSGPAKAAGARLRVNGREVPGAFQALTAQTYDVVQQVEIPAAPGPTVVELELEGGARAGVQVSGRYYLPWSLVREGDAPPLSIAVDYDRDTLKLSDTLKAKATLQYRGPGTFMVIADLGVPPGFTPDPGAFEELVKRGTIDKYAITGRQITLYFGRIESGRRVEIEYSLTPRFPIRAKAPRSRAYEYYTPQNEGSGPPRDLRVTEEF